MKFYLVAKLRNIQSPSAQYITALNLHESCNNGVHSYTRFDTEKSVLYKNLFLPLDVGYKPLSGHIQEILYITVKVWSFNPELKV
jgi:hypothetical protein